MFKYMKYEIRGTYRYILGVLALVLILITGLYVYIDRMGRTGEISAIGGTFMGLSVMILFGTALATFLYIVGSFRKELYEDRGYLTFTLPLTGNQIVCSKLIVASIWFLGLGIAIGLYNILMVAIFAPVEVSLSELFREMSAIVAVRKVLFSIISGIFSIVNMLIIIYFSMALGRVTFRNKRIGGLWFIIFIIISILLGSVALMISDYLPYYLDLNTSRIGTLDSIRINYQINIDVNAVAVKTSSDMATINIASTIFNIATTVLLFLGTGYLIDRKIDL